MIEPLISWKQERNSVKKAWKETKEDVKEGAQKVKKEVKEGYNNVKDEVKRNWINQFHFMSMLWNMVIFVVYNQRVL